MYIHKCKTDVLKNHQYTVMVYNKKEDILRLMNAQLWGDIDKVIWNLTSLQILVLHIFYIFDGRLPIANFWNKIRKMCLLKNYVITIRAEVESIKKRVEEFLSYYIF